MPTSPSTSGASRRRSTTPSPRAPPGHAFDVGPVAQLEAHPEAEGGPTGTDPHFWLDPLRLAAVGDALAARLGDLDPTNAATFAANAATLRTDLQALDEELRAGLASCANRLLVTSHAAFGYFAERYGLEQHAITDLTPEAEPTPESLAAIADFVRANGVTTIYSETLVSPAVAKAVAGESGARVAVLDPIEGLAADAAATTDYFSIMRTNLATLRAGQPCP